MNALALGADEGRDKLRKAAGISKYEMIRRCPNGAIRMEIVHASISEFIAYGGEPPELKHLSRARKRNQTRFRK